MIHQQPDLQLFCLQIADKKDFIDAFEKRVFEAYRLDGIICPVLPTPALKHFDTTDLSATAASTFLYNVSAKVSLDLQRI